MAATLPYLSTPGTLKNAFEKIKAAATPPTVNNDFVESKLKIKGGAGRAIPPFLKKIGLVAGDGKPTTLYERFRNSNAAVSGNAIAQAIRHGYRPLYEVNEYAHELGDKDLKGLIVQVTGLEDKNRVVELAHSTFKKLKEFADFEAEAAGEIDSVQEPVAGTGAPRDRRTTKRDAEVIYHATFGALRAHLFRGSRPGSAEVDHLVQFCLSGIAKPKRARV